MVSLTPSSSHAFASIPMQTIGPVKLSGDIQEEVFIPLATYETPLWASTQRGAKISTLCKDGITVTLLSDGMTRSIILEATSAQEAREITKKINLDLLKSAVQESSQHACLINIQPEILGKLIYLRLVFSTGEASGHNMATKASDFIIQKLLALFPTLSYISISGNTCCDKKTSAINSLLGRGKSVIAELIIPPEICQKFLKTTPEKIVDLNIKKNLLGSLLAGSLRSANAHYANILLAAYLATGQDAANIVEGSQGITHAEILENQSLYFSIKIPNLIIGTHGNGKHLDFVQENLKNLACLEKSNLNPSYNSQRLAMIIASAVLCCELSLLAAQTNPGELMRSHLLLERKNNHLKNKSGRESL